ncbi:MAG: SDR family oxidoreductase, partial [Pseudonocardiaceae bacterium]|nr:SDR family oxidoreductase [Pseudonocardiaceae bacterium]
MATYLVTGATGLIGRHFVAEILARPDTERVWLLVRERSQDKLAEVARDWPAPEKTRDLVGDVRAERLGIGAEQVAELTGAVDHLVHLAALYDIAADDDASIAANVDGTRHVLDLAAALEVGCLHHVSSVAVAGDYRGRFTEEMFDAGQRLVTPYHRTKFESERLVRSQTDVPWRIYRPAIVVGNSVTGEMDKIDGPYYFFPALARLSSMPSVPLVFPDIGDTNIVPVDYVAAAMAHLVTAPGLDGRAFHLVNPEPQSARSVYDAFAKAAGAPRSTAALGPRLTNPLLRLVKLAEHVPGVTIARDAVLDR